MGQQEIMDFLEKEYRKNSNRLFTRKEIAIGLGNGIKKDSPYLSRSLRIAREKGDVYWERDNNSKNPKRPFYYRYKPNSDEIVIEIWQGAKDTIRLNNFS